MQAYLMIGEITKPQGVHGELKLRPVTCDPSRFEDLELAYLKEGEAYRRCAYRCAARARTRSFSAWRAWRPATTRRRCAASSSISTARTRWRWTTIRPFSAISWGCAGVLSDGGELGELTGGHAAGGQRRVRLCHAEGRGIVPALKSVVLKVDLAAGEMLLDSARMPEVAVYDED